MTMKVLIVEDEILDQKSLTRVLSQKFPDMEIVGTATSIKGTVAWLKERSNEVDVIFMDVEALTKALEGTASRKDYKERYIVRFNDRIVPLQTSDIAYIYSEEKNNYLVTFDKQRYIIDSSLDVIYENLNPEYFFRISRGCIVSMKAIGSIIKQMGGRLRIVAQPEPPFVMTVSRPRVDDFLIWLEK